MNLKKGKNVVTIVNIVLLEIAVIALAIYNKGSLGSILQPIIIGLTLAYVVNPLMNLLEKYTAIGLKKMIKKEGKGITTASRAISIFVSLGLILGLIVFIFAMLIPELVNSITQLSETLPSLIRDGMSSLSKKLHISNIYDSVIDKASNNLVTLVTSVSSQAANMVISVATVIKDFFIGFIIAAYVLFNKETLLVQCKKLMRALIRKESRYESVLEDIRGANRIFTSFFTGKILDSMIIGIICFIAMMIFGLPYSVLVSVVIGITNIIPFFGPFIGAIPSALLITIADPWSGLYFIIMIIVLQAFDGYILGPRILGNSTGLTPLWVMIAILVFGGLFGFIGMLFGVPVLAVIFMLLKRVVNRRLEENKTESVSVPEDKN